MAKPFKSARRPSSEKEKEPGSIRVNLAKSGKCFLLLYESGLGEAMEVGCDLGPSPSNLYMAKVGELKLKRARSPPRLALSLVVVRESEPSPCQEVNGNRPEEQ